MKRIKVLGITGGVGAGKSTVLDYLQRRYGAEVIQLDLVAHQLMKKGEACWQQITQTYGEDILDAGGEIDHAKLYEKAFGEGQNLRKLNMIVHPQVKRRVRERIDMLMQRGDVPFVVIEAALLLDDHYELICDEIWYIYVDEAVRRRRLMESRGYSQEKISGILANQKTDGEFRAGCQFVVDNSSDILENTYEQIDRGLKEHEFV